MLRTIIYERDFYDIFIMQYGIGNLVPLILFLIPGLTIRRTLLGVLLVLFGVFMMRWNVVIGGQLFSKSFLGYTVYKMDFATREGLLPAVLLMILPFVILAVLVKMLPPWHAEPETRR